MIIPNANHATLDIRKLSEYCLNAGHLRGQHKARVFRASLGIDHSHAAWLREQILNTLPQSDVFEEQTVADGTRYIIDISVSRQSRDAMLRTVWSIATADNAPRFLTCWVK